MLLKSVVCFFAANNSHSLQPVIDVLLLVKNYWQRADVKHSILTSHHFCVAEVTYYSMEFAVNNLGQSTFLESIPFNCPQQGTDLHVLCSNNVLCASYCVCYVHRL